MQIVKIIKEALKINQMNGSAIHNVPDPKLIKSFDNTKKAADKLCKKVDQLIKGSGEGQVNLT